MDAPEAAVAGGARQMAHLQCAIYESQGSGQVKGTTPDRKWCGGFFYE